MTDPLLTFARAVKAVWPDAVMTRYVVLLKSPKDRELARRAIDRAPFGYAVDIKEGRRSDEQNRALWSMLGQIQKQRPTHNGIRMTPDLWKAVFMQALGAEMVMLPTLDGDGYFPLGHRSSQLTTAQFADLLTLILAWCAREQVSIKHFDEAAAA